METKIVKTLRFADNTKEEYQINAAKLEGYTADGLRSSVTTDYLQPGASYWIFDGGTAFINVDNIES